MENNFRRTLEYYHTSVWQGKEKTSFTAGKQINAGFKTIIHFP